MEQEISQMKRENAKLKSAGEELEAQLLNYRFESLRMMAWLKTPVLMKPDNIDGNDNLDVNNSGQFSGKI